MPIDSDEEQLMDWGGMRSCREQKIRPVAGSCASTQTSVERAPARFR